MHQASRTPRRIRGAILGVMLWRSIPVALAISSVVIGPFALMTSNTLLSRVVVLSFAASWEVSGSVFRASPLISASFRLTDSHMISHLMKRWPSDYPQKGVSKSFCSRLRRGLSLFSSSRGGFM
jgi:hypothetical protein